MDRRLARSQASVEAVPIVSSRKFIVGLGNPGPEYETTRHNLGFLTVDAFARMAGFGRAKKRFQAMCREERVGDHSVVLVKPMTYMNLSGNAVRDLLAYHRVTGGDRAGGFRARDERDDDDSPDFRDSLLVIYDDLDLPFGRLRYRARGSSGGHRGLRSVIRELKTERFSRLKIGVGRDDEQLPADYVLEPLRGAAEEELVTASRVAAATIPLWLEEGVVACANRYNSGAE